jgi:hypothetical protein
MLHIQSLSVTPSALLAHAHETLYWRDSPAFGPWPHYPGCAEELAQRQLFWKTFLRMSSQEAEEPMQAERNTVSRLQASVSDGEEVVFWYEGRVWSECALLQVHSIVSRASGSARFSVVRASDRPTQDANIDQRVRLSASDRQALDKVIQAIRSDRPERLALLGHQAACNVLRLDALGSFLCGQFPSVRNGLSQCEEKLLRLVSGGPTPVSQIVAAKAASGDNESGDLLDDAILYGLSSCPMPLVNVQENKNFAKTEYRLTSLGERVLDGRADHASINGVDRWVGGTHVVGKSPHWRYDNDRGALIERKT